MREAESRGFQPIVEQGPKLRPLPVVPPEIAGVLAGRLTRSVIAESKESSDGDTPGSTHRDVTTGTQVDTTRVTGSGVVTGADAGTGTGAVPPLTTPAPTGIPTSPVPPVGSPPLAGAPEFGEPR